MYSWIRTRVNFRQFVTRPYNIQWKQIYLEFVWIGIFLTSTQLYKSAGKSTGYLAQFTEDQATGSRQCLCTIHDIVLSQCLIQSRCRSTFASLRPSWTPDESTLGLKSRDIFVSYLFKNISIQPLPFWSQICTRLAVDNVLTVIDSQRVGKVEPSHLKRLRSLISCE